MGERYCLSCGKPMDTSSATATDCRSCDAQAPLLATIETLEAALEPFDDALGEDDEFPDDTPITAKWGRTTYYALTLGDLRRARDARNALGRKG